MKYILAMLWFFLQKPAGGVAVLPTGLGSWNSKKKKNYDENEDDKENRGQNNKVFLVNNL